MKRNRPIDSPRRRRRRVSSVAISAALLCAISTATPTLAEESHFSAERKIVERLHSALLESMQSASLRTFEDRSQALESVVLDCFDFSFMAEKSAGRYWRELDAGQRRALTAAIAELAVSNYAARFDGFDGEVFETTGAEAANYQTVLVRTRIVQPGGTATRLDYRLHERADGPRIIDIFLNGTVSELAMRRAEYSSVIKREGFDALLAALRQRVAALPVSARR